jgi:AcrR family transcriptional regulator
MTPPRTRVRASNSKEKLFAAALGLIGRDGPANISVDEIAAAAGVAKGTVYYNFGSKDGLFEALVQYGIELFSNALKEARKEQDALPAMISATLDFFNDYWALAQLLVGELWRTSGQWHETLLPLRDNLVRIFSEVLAEKEAEGKLPPDVRVDTTSAALFGALLVIILDWRVYHPERGKDDVHGSIMSLVRGIAR